MSTVAFDVVLLDKMHDRGSFNSDSEPLDRYLKHQANQDVKRRIAACFIATSDGRQIAGYYTLASTSVLLTDLPDSVIQKLPRYASIPAVRLGRLAVDQAFKGRGLGAALLADAFTRAARAEIAAYALVVDAKDEIAISFYRHHGFISFPDLPTSLFLPLASARLPL